MKLVATLEDLDEFSLYEVPDELYNRIIVAMGNPQYPNFQLLYDNYNTPGFEELFEELMGCKKIQDVEFIQIY